MKTTLLKSTIGAQITMFGRCIPSGIKLTFNKVNELAMKCGYIVHESLCTDEVYNWLKDQEINHNSTFYRNWSDITSKSRFELFLDQIMHYSSTYGTDYKGIPYVPNDGSVVDFSTYKLLEPITEYELFLKCSGMLYSGIALKEETLISILDIISSIDMSDKLEINLIRNREAKFYYYRNTGTLPESAEEMVKYLVFLITGKTMIIKNKEMINDIKTKHSYLGHYMDKFGLDKLSAVFFRFKPLFLAMKKHNKVEINTLRRLADTNHIPYQPGYFEVILQNQSLMSKIDSMLPKLNNYKKIALMQAILVRQKELTYRPFIVRNQKLFIKQETIKDKEYYGELFSLLHDSLVQSLSKKACSVKLPGINLVLPKSEKSFIGNLPIGSWVGTSGKDTMIGIHWKAVDGANDIDLSYTSIKGERIGWNTDYNSYGLVYSGDMTSARPEASEIIHASRGLIPGIVKVNLFRGVDDSKFKFFIGIEKPIDFNRGYMIQPDNIIFQTELKCSDKETTLGIITDDRFVFANLRTGRKAVSGISITDLYIDYTLKTADCYVDLRDTLVSAGFTIVDDNPDLDLSTLEKSSLIDLLR